MSVYPKVSLASEAIVSEEARRVERLTASLKDKVNVPAVMSTSKALRIGGA